MKCPNCDGLISGSAVVCKACGQRLTQASIEKWRAERNAAARNEPEVKESPMAVKLRARFATKQSTRQENNLLQFPVPPNAPIHHQTAATSNEPAWRARIKASVQSHRERQESEAAQTAESSNADRAAEADAAAQLLLVESALKRIRRVPVAPPAPVAARVAAPPISYPSAQSHALALMPEAERYAEARREREEMRQAHDEPVLELEDEPLPPPRLPPAAEKLRALRTRHSTLTNLAYQIDEDPLEITFDEAPLVAENLPELALAQEEDRAQHATTADRLRAKAALHEQTFATEAPPASPWHTDEEVAEVKGQVWLGQPASVPMRVLAGICDIEAAALLYLPFFGAYYTMDGALDFDDYYIMALMIVVVMFLYQLVTFTLNGRTLGMAIFGLRNFDVEQANQRISFKRRLQQAFGGTVSLLCPPFNFVVTRVTGFQRGFGDALAGTVTLRRAQE
jgi:hypothetical protein